MSAVSDGSWAARRRSLMIAFLVFTQLAAVLAILHKRDLPPSSLSDEHSTSVVSGASLSEGISDSILIALGTGSTLAAIILTGWPIGSAAAAKGDSIPEVSAPRPRLLASDDSHDTLIARLHHDLRTPLNAMLGFADLMQSEAFGPLGNERYRTYAAHMRSCGHELLQATESTLAMAEILASPDLGTMVAIDLRLMAEKAWAAALLARTTTALPVRMLIPQGVRVRADAMALRQSLVNLYSAAISRSQEGGQVEISANCHGGRIQIMIKAASGAPVDRIASTGCRPCSSSWNPIEEMPLTVSRKLLGLQGIALEIAADTPHTWAVTFSIEDAVQPDLFEDHRPVATAKFRSPASASHGDFVTASFSDGTVSCP